MILNHEKVEAFAAALYGCFVAAEFSAGDITKRFTPTALQVPANVALREALRGLMSGRPTKQRVGQLLHRDVVSDGIAWRGDYYRIHARHDARAKAWCYRIEKRSEQELEAEADRLLKVIEDDRVAKAEAFTDKLDAMPLTRQLRAIEKETEKAERLRRRFEKQTERADEKSRREAYELSRRALWSRPAIKSYPVLPDGSASLPPPESEPRAPIDMSGWPPAWIKAGRKPNYAPITYEESDTCFKNAEVLRSRHIAAAVETNPRAPSTEPKEAADPWRMIR